MERFGDTKENQDSQSPPETMVFPLPETAYNQSKEKKPKTVQIISLLIIIIAVIYGFESLKLLNNLSTLNNIFETGGLQFIFRDFPTISLLPIIFSLTILILLYISIKIQNSSRFSFFLGIIILCFILIPLRIFTISLLAPLNNLINPADAGATPNLKPVQSLGNFSLKNLIEPVFILYSIVFLMLIFSSKKFNFENTGLSTKSKVFLIIIIIFLVIPVVSSMAFISFVYLQNDKDYGFIETQPKVNFHLYKPSYIPLGLIGGKNFTSGPELTVKNDITQTIFSLPPNQSKKEATNPLITLSQVKVDPGFDFNSFVTKRYRYTVSTDTIPLPLSETQKAIYAELVQTTVLAFVTTDNILIYINAAHIPKEELIRMAESLK